MTGEDREDASTHPDPAALAAFARGGLPQEAARAVVAHLLAGCAACRGRLAPLVAALHRPEPVLPERYDMPVQRSIAFAVTFARQREAVRERAAELVAGAPPAPGAAAPAARPPHGWAWCELLLDVAEGARREDPRQAVMTSALAVAQAESLDPGRHGAAVVADLQARAWGELANARRLAQDFEGAETAFDEALERFEHGTEDLRLYARLLDLLASLHRDRRQFEEASQLFQGVATYYRRLGEDHLAGRALIKRGSVAALALDPAGAVQSLASGLALLDGNREPKLMLAAIHNLEYCLIELQHFEEAGRILWSYRAFYKKHGSALDLLRLRWLEGKVAAGLDQARRAERIFREVRSGFEGEKLPYDAALVSLDLGVILLEDGRTSELRRLADEMLLTFHLLGIGREALASFLLLHEAIHQERATAALFRAAARELERTERPREQRG